MKSCLITYEIYARVLTCDERIVYADTSFSQRFVFLILCVCSTSVENQLCRILNHSIWKCLKPDTRNSLISKHFRFSIDKRRHLRIFFDHYISSNIQSEQSLMGIDKNGTSDRYILLLITFSEFDVFISEIFYRNVWL